STDVITSIGCFVIGLLLVFALGLPMFVSTSQDGPHRALTTKRGRTLVDPVGFALPAMAELVQGPTILLQDSKPRRRPDFLAPRRRSDGNSPHRRVDDQRKMGQTQSRCMCRMMSCNFREGISAMEQRFGSTRLVPAGLLVEHAEI